MTRVSQCHRCQVLASYKKLALQWHPDKVTNDASMGKFQEIGSAVLSSMLNQSSLNLNLLQPQHINDCGANVLGQTVTITKRETR